MLLRLSIVSIVSAIPHASTQQRNSIEMKSNTTRLKRMKRRESEKRRKEGKKGGNRLAQARASSVDVLGRNDLEPPENRRGGLAR